MLGLISPSIGVATNVGRVVGRLQSLKAVPEECDLLLRTLESIDGALQLAICFQKRHRSLQLFDGAVCLAQGTIEACERLLAGDDGEDLPESQEGWIAWLGRQTKGIRRQDALPKLTARLGVCMSSLQLAFAALGALQSPIWCTPGGTRQPFVLIHSAVEQARSVVQEFEMGRRRALLGCMGRLYTRSPSALEARAGEQWQADEVHTLSVELRDDCYFLRLQEAPQVGSQERGQDEGATTFRVASASLRVTRQWLGDCPGIHPHERCEALEADQPLYILSSPSAQGVASYAILFEVPPFTLEDEPRQALSAEAFEAVLVMLLLKEGLEDGSHCLAHVCDLDSPLGLQDFREMLCEKVGLYTGKTADDDGSLPLLSSRMKKVALGP